MHSQFFYRRFDKFNMRYKFKQIFLYTLYNKMIILNIYQVQSLHTFHRISRPLPHGRHGAQCPQCYTLLFLHIF